MLTMKPGANSRPRLSGGVRLDQVLPEPAWRCRSSRGREPGRKPGFHKSEGKAKDISAGPLSFVICPHAASNGILRMTTCPHPKKQAKRGAPPGLNYPEPFWPWSDWKTGGKYGPAYINSPP